ncbi:MAG: preprotein translocase subunit SecY [Armatimonadetes bacterium]|nr:preprotein translocase subunit SecY [Armatimonadota bacterium]
MVGSFINAFRVPEVRSRILWLFGGFSIFALSVHVPIPGVDRDVWRSLLQQGALFQLLGMFTGGALNKFAIVAMGITPYINASIIMQLLTVVYPHLKDLQKEGGEHGRRKIGMYTRQLTMVLAILQATMMTISLANYKGAQVFFTTNPIYLAMVIAALVAGTAFLMWLGELMSERGIGNGVSLLIFGGIVMSYPAYIADTIATATVAGPRRWIALVFFFAMSLFLIVSIIYITLGQRKVPVQYPKRQVGRKIYGGQSTYIPIRVNNAGVISLIFAISIMYLPSTLVGFLPGDDHPVKNFLAIYFNPLTPLYNIMYGALVVFFTYFYSQITFNVEDIADNLKKAGGFIPGIRPGRPTAEYLDKLLNRLTLISGLFLAFIAIAPTIVMQLTDVKEFYLGATSLLIIVGVALDTMQQIEARLVMRHYEGFMK